MGSGVWRLGSGGGLRSDGLSAVLAYGEGTVLLGASAPRQGEGTNVMLCPGSVTDVFISDSAPRGSPPFTEMEERGTDWRSDGWDGSDGRLGIVGRCEQAVSNLSEWFDLV